MTGDRIEAGSRLIEDEQLGPPGQDEQERGLDALPVRDSLDALFGVEAKSFQQLLCVGFVPSLDRFFDASLVPETCQEFPLFAKSDTGFDSASYGRNHPGASCPISSMAPVLAITGMVARTSM